MAALSALNARHAHRQPPNRDQQAPPTHVQTALPPTVRWSQLLTLTGSWAAAEPKRLRWGLWHTPARIVSLAGRHIVRILDGWPTVNELLGAYGRIAALT